MALNLVSVSPVQVSGGQQWNVSLPLNQVDSNTAVANITVIPVDDPPVLTTFGPSTYTEDNPPVVVDPALTLTDV